MANLSEIEVKGIVYKIKDAIARDSIEELKNDNTGGSEVPDVIDGKSAYQIAVDHGFEGSEEEWLESLKGKSAYQIALMYGFEGSEEEWVDSLHGADGKSAYQIAVDHGFEGSEAEWLESLKAEGSNSNAPSEPIVIESIAAEKVIFNDNENLQYKLDNGKLGNGENPDNGNSGDGTVSVINGKEYYATYGPTTLESTGVLTNDVFSLIEVDSDKNETVKSQFVIKGSSSGGSSTVLVVERITKSPIVVTTKDKVEISINFSSTDTDGEPLGGSYVWKNGTSVLSSGILTTGLNTFDMTEHVSIGTQRFTLTVMDDGGNEDIKSWTVQMVDIRLASNFSDRIKYEANKPVSFTYTPYGAVEKTVHFILDGEELDPFVTTVSGSQQSYTLPAQEHGAHMLECYITATIDNMDIETEHIYKDIIWFDEEATTPVIGCAYRFDHYGHVDAKQHNTLAIPYVVFHPETEKPSISKIVNGTLLTTQVLESSLDTWAYKPSEIGEQELIIACGDVQVPIKLDVVELGIDVTPITSGLAFDFNPTGLSNSSENRLWKDSNNANIKLSVSDNFDWVNGGYQLDADGNQYFCVKAGNTATISYNLFGTDLRVSGAEFKTIFKVTNVQRVDATFLTCMDESVGLKMNVHEAYVSSSANKVQASYCEDDVIEFEYNIGTLDMENSDATAILMTYEDGVGLRPMIYDSTHRFNQYNPAPITIGSEYCDVHIYRMKAYSITLTDIDILSNFIADSRDSDTMISRHTRNQIYNENNALTPESVASACPNLKVIKIDCPYFTNDKKNFVKNTSVECIHKNGDIALDNWKFTKGYHSGQGTTSNEYGFAGRNIDLIMCCDGVYTKDGKLTYLNDDDADTYRSELILGDGTTISDGTGKVTLSRTSVPTAYFNIKVNIASSENANNALLAKRYNDNLPYISPARKNNPNVKNTMEFVNCVVFLRENDPDISTHREFQDNEWHFYALGNIGDSKSTDNTRCNDANDPKEFVVEIADNTYPNSAFPTGLDHYPISKSEWVPGNTAYDSLHSDAFDGDGTYEFRYEMEGITDEQRAVNINTWNEFYEWVVTATNEEFKSNLKDWFVVDSALYFYLFTEQYTMLDNRAKNTFWHWGKVYITQAEAEALGNKAKGYTIDEEAAAINDGYRFEMWDYDNDSSLGINNTGELTMTYGKEDIDYKVDGDPNSGFIFNAAESVFWRRIRETLHDELCTMYQRCETNNCWSDTQIINQFDNWQDEFPEELWRLDIERKYLRTYLAGTRRFLESMLQGRKKYQRRQFLRDQVPYFGTKYVGNNIKADQIMFRCNTPQNAPISPDYTVRVVPYSDMYLSVLFGNSAKPKQIRAKAGQSYSIECPFTTMDDTAVLIYCASRIQALNDLSASYIHDNDFSKAVKLKELTIGNSSENYSNSFLTTLNIGNNPLLEKLDIRNCPNLVGAINLSACSNLQELYAEGTSLTGVLFATGGKISVAHLPDTVNTLTMKNLIYMTDLDLNLDNLETLTIENSTIDSLSMVQESIDTLRTLRLVGIDWNIKDTELLNDILDLYSSYLAGKVFISGAVRENDLNTYDITWTDLDVTYNPLNLIPQHKATFVNYDGTVLFESWFDQGSSPIDPVTNGDINTPVRESTEQYDFTYSGWNFDFTSTPISSVTIMAQYTEKAREYTISWYKFETDSMPIYSKSFPYGSDAEFDYETYGVPTNTSMESAMVYHLFNGWDKSTGNVSRDLKVYALWERGQLPNDGFDSEKLNAADVYSVINTESITEKFTLKDRVAIQFGFNPNYTNIKYTDVATEEKFNGTKHIDTGIKLLKNGINTPWTVVADMTFKSTETETQTMLSCIDDNISQGFRISYTNDTLGPVISWSTSKCNTSASTNREIMILRHEAGSRSIKVYYSNMTGNTIGYSELTKTVDTMIDNTLILGADKFNDGSFGNFAVGTLHSCRIWEADLGDMECRKIACWPRETYLFEMGSFGAYTEKSSNKATNIDFICASLLSRVKSMNPGYNNNGGFFGSDLYNWMSTRLIDAFPTPWRLLMKECNVKTNLYVDGTDTNVKTFASNIWIPSIGELKRNPGEPWMYEGSIIGYFGDNQSRIKFKGISVSADNGSYNVFNIGIDPVENGDSVKDGDLWIKTSSGRGYIRVNGVWEEAIQYWLRGASIYSSSNFTIVDYKGETDQYGSGASSQFGVCSKFSI